ncbi:MAG: hypothetical protein O2821_06470 [Chloroflexi bacterium]|nr:hypothetical protein [Chloroflexota bacterium]MDA1228707.1 hypothetical protein [Chloroflexota bacterium]
MPPNIADWVAAVAAFLAVGTAIFAILTVFLVRNRARREDARRWQEAQRYQLQERASVVRHNLQSAVAYSDDLSRQLCSLRPLISGASNIADQVYYRVGPDVTAAKVQSALAHDTGFAATVCTAGWNTSPQTKAMDGIRADLRLAGLALAGQLTLVTRAIELYDDMIDAGCSPAVFEGVLNNELLMRLFLEEHRSQKDSQRLVNSLASTLQAEATSHFRDHMKLSVEYLNDFIKIAGNEFIGWSDEKLMAASVKENPAALDSSTKVDYIQVVLKQLRPEFHGPQIFEVMALLVGCIDAFSAVRRGRV